MAEPKHLAFNHQEMNRSGISIFFNEQAGRETELGCFQGCMSANNATMVMTGLATGIMNMVLSALQYSASNISSPAIRAAMPWLFIGGETICCAVIFAMFLFMNVERFSKVDHIAIRLDQDPDAEIEAPEDNETLRIFSELRRKNGKTELKAKG